MTFAHLPFFFSFDVGLFANDLLNLKTLLPCIMIVVFPSGTVRTRKI